VEPPVRQPDGVWHRLLRGTQRLVRATARWARRTGYALTATRVLERRELEADERTWLEAIESLLRSGSYRLPTVTRQVSVTARVEFVSRGTLPARVRCGRGRCLVLIPRVAAVAEMVEAHAFDRSCLYPSLALLFAGHDGFGGRKLSLQRALLGVGS
jgi:hypothetical protein